MTPAKLERDGLLYSIDINGYRAKRPITHLTDDVDARIKQLSLNGSTISHQGDIVQLDDSFQRMTKAIGVGVLLLFVVLTAIYGSLRLAGVMILVLPLSLIGAAWGMLIFDKPSCMPSMLGVLLLFGIIIKNSVLLIDFYQTHRATNPPYESALESIKIRFRPVMMTAFGTIAGMLPIAFEWAVGLERLSPLADVAIGGLLVGTLLTLVCVPLAAYTIDRETKVQPKNGTAI
ncbi:MAG: efflux RND transporter permease subunit [Campylobacterales bacterium]